MIATSPSLDDN